MHFSSQNKPPLAQQFFPAPRALCQHFSEQPLCAEPHLQIPGPTSSVALNQKSSENMVGLGVWVYHCLPHYIITQFHSRNTVKCLVRSLWLLLNFPSFLRELNPKKIAHPKPLPPLPVHHQSPAMAPHWPPGPFPHSWHVGANVLSCPAIHGQLEAPSQRWDRGRDPKIRTMLRWQCSVYIYILL